MNLVNETGYFFSLNVGNMPCRWNFSLYARETRFSNFLKRDSQVSKGCARFHFFFAITYTRESRTSMKIFHSDRTTLTRKIEVAN